METANPSFLHNSILIPARVLQRSPKISRFDLDNIKIIDDLLNLYHCYIIIIMLLLLEVLHQIQKK